MRHYEPLEARRALAVLDLNPGPAWSNYDLHGQIGDWVYLSADTEQGRALVRTDGESVENLGPALDKSIVRADELIGLSEGLIVRIDDGTRTTVSDRPGAKFGDTVYWLDLANARNYWSVDYSDVDGRQFTYAGNLPDNQQYFMAINGIEDGKVIATGELGPLPHGALVCLETCERVGDYPHTRRPGARFVIARDNNLVDINGNVMGVDGDEVYTYDGGFWTVTSDDRIVHNGTVVGTAADAYLSPSIGNVVYWSDTEILWIGSTQALGGEPYLTTDAGTEFLGDQNTGISSSNYRGTGTFGGVQTISNRFWVNNTLLGPTPLAIIDRLVFRAYYDVEHGQEISADELLAGDADYDGIFDSGDLVQLFQLGEYEDDLVGNSGWLSGDFNGDGEFDTADLVAAFALGTYRE